MADWSSVLGGVGKGLMQGTEFINQKRQADDQKAYRDQVLANQAQQLQMQQDAFKLKTDEVKRLDQLGSLKNQIAQDYPDATDPYHQQQLLISEGVKKNLFRGDELDKAYDLRSKLRTTFGTTAYDSAIAGDIKPLQTLLGERGISVDYTPDRKALNLWSAASKPDAQGNLQPVQTLSVEGLQQLDAMGMVRERELSRQKAAQDRLKFQAEFGKTAAETDLAKAKAELTRTTAAGKNPMTLDENGNPVANPLYAGKGGKGGGAGGGSGGGGALFEATGFKNIGDLQEFVSKGLPEGDITAVGADKKEFVIPRDKVLRDTTTNIEGLMRENRGLPPLVARTIGFEMAKTQAGAVSDGGVYQPKPTLQKDGQWATFVRTTDGGIVRVPSAAAVTPSPDEKFSQESAWAQQLVDSGEAQQLTAELRANPGRVKEYVRALNGDAEAKARLEVWRPGALRKFEVLFAHTGLGGLVVPDQRLNAERAAVQEHRRAILNDGQAKPGGEGRQPASFSEAEQARARELGAGKAVGLGEALSAGAQEIGKGLGAVGDALLGDRERMNFMSALEGVRTTNFRSKPAAQRLADMIQKNPELRKELSDDDLFRLQFAIDQRF